MYDSGTKSIFNAAPKPNHFKEKQVLLVYVENV